MTIMVYRLEGIEGNTIVAIVRVYRLEGIEGKAMA